MNDDIGRLRDELSALHRDNALLRDRLDRFAKEQRNTKQELDAQIQRARSAEADARTARKHLAEAFERVTDAFVALDKEWRYTYVNAKAGEMLGRRPEELVGKHIWTEFPGRLGQPFRRAYERAMTQQRIMHLEDYYAPWDRWFENVIYPAPDGLSIYFHDITERKRREAEAEQAQQRLMDIVEHLPDAVFVIDRDKRVIAWNRACEEMTCVKKEAVLGRGDLAYSEAFFGARRPMLVDLLDQPVPEVEATYEYLRRTKDLIVAESFVPEMKGGRGAHVWAEASPLYDRHGLRWGALEVLRDVTEQTHMERALKDSQERLLRAQRVAGVGFLDWDLKSNEIYLSDETCALTGFTPEGQITTPEFVARTVHPDDLEYTRTNLELAIQDVRPYDIVHRHLRPDGSILWVHAQAKLYRDEQGAPDRLLGTIVDITGMKEVEQALRESEVKHRTLFESASDAIFLMRGDRFIDCNARTLEMFGCARDQILGQSPHRFSPPTQPDGRPSKDEALKKIARASTQGPQRFEWTHCRLDGTPFTADVTLNRIDLDDSECLQAIVRDVSERKKTEEELAKYRGHLEEEVAERTRELAAAKARAESADQLKSAFLATMSHELRTPLNSIIGFTGILMQEIPGSINDEQRKQLTMVRSSARHLLSLINDVLDISRIEAGQLEIQREPFDVREAIETVVKLVTPRVAEKGLQLVLEFAPNVGRIDADRRRLEQVVLNLLGNAIKFTDHGEVSVRCALKGDVLETRVCDTGIGIAAEHMPHLFVPFRQLDTGLARRYEGTGLGLSICKRLVELMGGSIHAASEPGVGSTFAFSLPVAGGEGALHDEADPDRRGQRAEHLHDDLPTEARRIRDPPSARR